MPTAAQTLQRFIKSGEGSRGGHIIGHSKTGHPIYAHHSVGGHEIKPLANGHEYNLSHLEARDLDEDNPKRIHSDLSFDGEEIPLPNGHKIITSVEVKRHSDPAFDIDHYIADKDNKPVEGASIGADLQNALEYRADTIHDKLVNEYRSGEGSYFPDNGADRDDDRGYDD